MHDFRQHIIRDLCVRFLQLRQQALVMFVCHFRQVWTTGVGLDLVASSHQFGSLCRICANGHTCVCACAACVVTLSCICVLAGMCVTYRCAVVDFIAAVNVFMRSSGIHLFVFFLSFHSAFLLSCSESNLENFFSSVLQSTTNCFAATFKS